MRHAGDLGGDRLHALDTAGLAMITLSTVQGGVDALAVVDALLDGEHCCSVGARHEI